MTDVKPVTYGSRSASMYIMVRIDGRKRKLQFKNGTLKLTDPKEIVAVEEFLRGSANASKMMYIVDMEAAVAIARAHKQQRGQIAHQGGATSEINKLREVREQQAREAGRQQGLIIQPSVEVPVKGALDQPDPNILQTETIQHQTAGIEAMKDKISKKITIGKQ